MRAPRPFPRATRPFSSLAVAVLAALTFAAFGCQKKAAPKMEQYLYIWAGDQAHKAPDFLAVVNFDSTSQDYGKVMTTVPLPDSGGTWNEPHHVGLSGDGTTLACGGLLSVLKGQKEIYFFDLTDPKAPKLAGAADPPLSGVADEFYPLEGGGFLVTMMGGAQGMAPGRVAEFDAGRNLVAEHPAEPPTDGFNPHGISVRPDLNLMVTSDFICPSSTLHAVKGDLMLRGSVRVWDFQARKILRSVPVGKGAGTIDVRLIPGDPTGRAYTAGMVDDSLYLIDTQAGTAKAVFDFSTIAKGGWPQLMRLTRDGKRLFVTMNTAGKVVMLDTTNPEQPALLKAVDLGPNSGPHYLALSPEETRLIVTDYFLNEDDAGKVHAEGDHKVHVLNVSANDFVLDPKFNLDMNTAVQTGPARPHGVAVRYVAPAIQQAGF
ncbi:MAG TPA: selenium-binding protein SBP56-related protein [Candidatus Eisenbacteria bacterium]